MKNKELKQEIALFLDKERYEVQKEEVENIMEENNRSFLNESQASSISGKQLL